jgi:hypothetical protein
MERGLDSYTLLYISYKRKSMQKEKILEARKKYKGWNSLFDTLETCLKYLTQEVSIKEITTRYGMLNVIFDDTNNPHLTYLVQGLSFKLERDSVKICVGCSARGARRSNLDNAVYCFHCWVDLSNKLESSSGEE